MAVLQCRPDTESCSTAKWKGRRGRGGGEGGGGGEGVPHCRYESNWRRQSAPRLSQHPGSAPDTQHHLELDAALQEPKHPWISLGRIITQECFSLALHHFLAPQPAIQSAPDAAPPAGAPGAPGAPGADGAPAGPPAPPNTSSNRRLQQTQAQVEEVVDIMRVNVDKVLERDQKLSELDDRADALQAGASQFESCAAKLKNKYWWKNCKMMIMMGIIGVIVVGIIFCNNDEEGEKQNKGKRLCESLGYEMIEGGKAVKWERGPLKETLSHLAILSPADWHKNRLICHLQQVNGQFEEFVSNLHGKWCP
ncbi:unnamed protein product [Menidia menidia]|uniref:(Atlantic silverside) hypothetical protein n=1 Tax=Menidia menidia TaxID=238744 RepID=A0A8S4BV33_9TELE|nr:unnamed protein product [Menidia menidia]